MDNALGIAEPNEAAECFFQEGRAVIERSIQFYNHLFAFIEVWLQKLFPEYLPAERAVIEIPSSGIPRKVVTNVHFHRIELAQCRVHAASFPSLICHTMRVPYK